MTIFDFMDKHWFLAFLIIYFTAQILAAPFNLLHRFFIRRAILLKHGWPPAHCDADGDPVENDDE